MAGLPGSGYVSLDEARTALRHFFDGLERDYARMPERAALALIRAATLGTLSSVSPPPPPPQRPPRQPPGNPLTNLIPGLRAPSPPPPPRERWPARFRVHVPMLRDHVRGALAAARNLLAAAQPPPPERIHRPWAEDAELLDHLHDLLTAGHLGDGRLALTHIESLRAAMTLRHDIDAAEYDGTNDEMFKFHVGTAPGETGRTTRPALITGGERLRHGEVRVPPPHPTPAATDDPPQSRDERGGHEQGN